MRTLLLFYKEEKVTIQPKISKLHSPMNILIQFSAILLSLLDNWQNILLFPFLYETFVHL